MKKVRFFAWIVLLIVLSAGTASAGFRDIPEGAFRVPIEEMERRGFIAGYADGTFRPANPVTAAQFVVILSRCVGLRPVDTAGTHWAADTMEAALRAGWYDWDELPPTGERFDVPVPRVLAVKILMKALLPDARGDYLTESQKIRDFAALDGRYYESVLAAYACGVVLGDSAGNFNPQGKLTRGAACALIYRALDVAESASAPEPERMSPQPDTMTPEPERMSPQPDTMAPEPERVSPQSGDMAPEPERVSPQPNTMTPEPERVSPQPNTMTLEPVSPEPKSAARGGVAENGWLQVKGAQLCNEAGEPVILHGMSSHGLQWYGQFTSAQAIENTAAWGANLFRVAMYTEEGGYLSDPENIRKTVIAAVDAAISRNLYVILDWHILSDGNPMRHIDEALAFFADMSERYRDCPAVLYEICNEPNGDVTWERDIKPYAEKMVGVIREHSPRGVILIGSGTWSQDIHTAARSPLTGDNLMYTLHFYAGTHGESLRQRLRDAVMGGLPVFVTEWGTSRADGSGGVYPEESAVWLDLLDTLGVSWANWSLCDKNETSAALRPGTAPDTVWKQEDLSVSGQFVFSRFADADN